MIPEEKLRVNQSKNAIISRLLQLRIAILDNIKAEESAITLYQSHIDIFNKLFSIKNPEVFKEVLLDAGLKYTEVNVIEKKVSDMISGGKQESTHIISIQHILDEEKEHLEEFNIMINTIDNILQFFNR